MPTFNNGRNGGSPLKSVVRDVEQLRLKRAFNTLESQINAQRATGELKELNRMRETYRLMVQYLSTGAPDPSREEMTDTLRRDILAMADRLEFGRLVSDSPGSYYSTARVLNHRGTSLTSLIADYDKAWLLYSTVKCADSYEPDITRQYEDALQELFRAVMSAPPGQLSDEDVKMLVMRATDPDADFALRSQITSALLVGILQHYDRNRLFALLSIYEESTEERIQAQALVGIVLALRYHSERPAYDRALSLRLQALADDLTLYPRLRDVFYTLLQTQDTKRAINFFQTKILPQIQKIKPDELKKMMEGAATGEGFDNPEWIEKIENSELGKKLRKLNDMQFEGADMMVMAFSHLKSFPFFGSPGNWLLPFDSGHSAVRSVNYEKAETLLEFLENADMMCDSDKYSFVLAVGMMPQAQRDMMTGSLSSNFEMIKEQMNATASTETRFKKETVRYLRNLYRLFTLSTNLFGAKRGTADDPATLLEEGFDIMALPYLGELLAQRDVIEIAAEFQFSRKNFKLAAPLIEELTKYEDADMGRLWEKLGYIYESKGEAEKALDYYRKAELMNPDSEWLLRHLAAMLEQTGRYDEASEKYAKLSTDDDPNSTARYALLLMKLGKNEEAKKLFHKLNYEASENATITFDRSLQPVVSATLSAVDLTAFWLAVAEMNLGHYEKASAIMPMTLPDEYHPFLILMTFLQGNYALAADGLKLLSDPDKADRAGELVARFEPEGAKEQSAASLLSDFFMRHIEAAGGSVTDFRLLADSVN